MNRTNFAVLIFITSCFWLQESVSSQPQYFKHAVTALKDPNHDPYIWDPRPALAQHDSITVATSIDLKAFWSHNRLLLAVAQANAAQSIPQSLTQLASSVLPAASDSNEFLGLPLPSRSAQASSQMTERPKPAVRSSADRHPLDTFQPSTPASIETAVDLSFKKNAEETHRAAPLPTNDSTANYNAAAQPASPTAKSPSYAPIRRKRRTIKEIEEASLARKVSSRKMLATCSECNTKIRKDSLRAHMIYRHTKDFKFKCAHCEKKGYDRSRLSRHYFNTHKDFVCQECNDFKQENNFLNENSKLRKHIRETHVQEI